MDILSISRTIFAPFDFGVTLVGDYALDGPDTAAVGLASDQFIVTLGAGTLPDPVDVTAHDGGAGGSFSVSFVTLSDGTRSATFTYTAAAAGTVTISVTNDGGLSDPDPITLTVSEPSPTGATDHGPIVMLTPAAARWFRHG
jgi:hypothetical protein